MQVDVGPLKAGQIARASFCLPSSAIRIDATVSVVWSSEKRQGLKFEHVTSKHEQAIRDFIMQIETQDLMSL